MSQDSLFDLDPIERDVERPTRKTSPPSRPHDTEVKSVEQLARKLEAASDPVGRAAVAADIRQLAESLFDANLRAANRQGMSWREIGRRIGIPFQTLHRHHGG